MEERVHQMGTVGTRVNVWRDSSGAAVRSMRMQVRTSVCLLIAHSVKDLQLGFRGGGPSDLKCIHVQFS